MCASSRRHCPRLVADQRGVATVEYVIVLGLVAVGLAIGVAGLGAGIVRLLQAQRAVLLVPL